MRKVLEITFAGEDYQTVLADNADDALAKLRSEKPTVVLVDHDLGGQSGYDLCQRIKSEAPGTRVLILSSKQHPYDSSRGGAAGADEHMDKPFDTQQMLDKVSNMLRAAPAQPSVQAAVTAPAPAAHAAPAAAAPVVAAKPRSQTLAYGTPAPSPSAPAPSAAPASAQPQRTQTYPGTPAVTPRPAPVQSSAPMQRPAPSPVAPPVTAPPVAAAPVAAAPVAAPAPAVAAHTGNGSELAGKLQGLGLNPTQVEAVLALSREVVEQVVWEVVPVLAETMIKEEIRRLTQEG
ncbi:MAG: response regulator [Polyangiaceae bacterium]|nr:response regulator [Polyangiaceae bacterium]MCB9608102.1 response regulator [Polyangiaceae bacterium]